MSSIAKSEDNSCKDVSIIFARGSGQNPNHEFLDKLSDERFRNKEPQSYTFFEEISKRLTGVSVERVSLHNFEGKYNQYGYQAISVESGFWSVGGNHRKDVSNRYYESVADGAEELAWYLEDKLTSCPFQTVILGGYSQGAHVVGDALFKIKPNFRPRIAYVALFGDPKFNPRTNALPPVTAPWLRGNASSWQTGVLLARKNYLPDEVALKGSWCDITDPVCANYSLSNTPISAIYDLFLSKTHQEAYQNRWIPQATNEIVSLIKNRNSALNGKIQTIPWVNKNDKLYQLDLAIVIDTTGSMVDEFKSIKKRLDGFVSSLFNSYWGTRIGIVAYNDANGSGKNLYFSKKLLDFTSSSASVRSIFETLEAKEGGDEPEAMYSGLMTAMNELSWRKGAQKKILVIADAPAHNPDPGPEHWTKEQVVKRALELDPASISFVKLPTTTKGWQVPYANTVNYLASNTNGTINEPTNYYGELITNVVAESLQTMEFLPVAEISGPGTGYTSEPLALSGGSSYDPDSYITSYDWDCNNDGTWETINNTQSTFECSYSKPYTGLVVLQIHSADGDSAKATLEVNITEKEDNVVLAPLSPVANYVRNGQDVVINWSNNYANDVSVRIMGNESEVLGLVTGQNSFTISQAPQTPFTILLDAGNEAGWSEQTALLIQTIPNNESDQSGNIFNIKNQSTPIATSVQTPALVDSFNPYPQDLAIDQVPEQAVTTVQGASSETNNQEDKVVYGNETFVTQQNSNLVTILLVVGMVAIGTGLAFITRRPK